MPDTSLVGELLALSKHLAMEAGRIGMEAARADAHLRPFGSRDAEHATSNGRIVRMSLSTFNRLSAFKRQGEPWETAMRRVLDSAEAALYTSLKE